MWSSNLELKKVKCGISYQARLHFPGFTSQKKCYHMLLFVKKKLGKCRLDNSKSCFSELKIWTPKLSQYNKMVCRDNNLDHQSSNMQMRLFYKFSLKLFYLLEWKTSKLKTHWHISIILTKLEAEKFNILMGFVSHSILRTLGQARGHICKIIWSFFKKKNQISIL